MRIDHRLLLLPLIPLAAIGVVEVSDRLAGTTEIRACAPAPIRDDLPKPVPVRTEAPRPTPPA
jgi:hypothetical protein